MAYNFPNSPSIGEPYGNYVWDSEKWQLPKGPSPDRATIYAAPFDAMAYNGMQVNGSMEVSQEWGAAGVGVANSSTTILDGWKLINNGVAVLTGSRSTNAPAGFQASLACQIPTANASPASGNLTVFSHCIEGYRVSRLAWGSASAQPITIGFWVFSSVITGPCSGSVVNNAGNRGYVFGFTINVAGAWEYKTITIPGDTTGAWEKTNLLGLNLYICLMGGSATLSAPGVWGGVAPVGATGTTNFVANTSNIFFLTGVVVLPGIEAPTAKQSPLIMRPFDQELVTCQRYWENGHFELQGGVAAGGVSIAASSAFRAIKRVAPTAIILSDKASAGVVATANFAIINPTVNGFLGNLGNSTTGGGYIGSFNWTADARL